MGLFSWLFGTPETDEQKATRSAQAKHTHAQKLMLLGNECSFKDDEAGAVKYTAEAAQILAEIVLAGPPSQVTGSRNLLNMCLDKPAVRAMFKQLIKQLEAIDKQSKTNANKEKANREVECVLEKLCQAYAANDGPAISQLELEATQIGQYLFDNGGQSALDRALDKVPDQEGKELLIAFWGRIGR